jgi:hypothetical protein
MKIPFDELIQDVKSELIYSGFKSNSPKLDALNDIDTLEELVAFLQQQVEMQKDEATEFLFNICVEVE